MMILSVISQSCSFSADFCLLFQQVGKELTKIEMACTVYVMQVE